jgi:hypothetical protein
MTKSPERRHTSDTCIKKNMIWEYCGVLYEANPIIEMLGMTKISNRELTRTLPVGHNLEGRYFRSSPKQIPL